MGDPNENEEEYYMGYYLAGEKSGTLSFTAPDEPGDYEFRLFEDDGYTDIARSNIVRVQEGTTVSTPTPAPSYGGDVHSIQSYIYPDYFIRHRNFLGEITKIVSALDEKDASFRVVPGLADSRYVSFESVNYPGYYLRHQNFRIKLHKKTDDELFKKDSTFKTVPGLADSSWVSFESYNYPGYFIRHAFWHLYIEKGDSDLFRKDATFRLVTPEYQPVGEKANAKPYIDVVVDDVVIDFGRLDDKRRKYDVGSAPGLPRNHSVPFPNVNYLPLRIPGIPNWGVYSAPPVPDVVPFEISASTELKRIPIIDDNPHPNITAHFNPSQYPGGMTCVYAIVADADGDAIDAEFVLPRPLFGAGNMYTAIPIPTRTNPITSEIKLSDGKTLAESFPDGYPAGGILYYYKVVEAYNAVLTEYANRGWLPLQPHVRTSVLPSGIPNLLLPFVAPTGPRRYPVPDIETNLTIVFTTPVRGEFPYVIGFNQSGIQNGYIFPEDIVTEAPNPWGLVPQGTVFKVIVVEGSWTNGDAKGYLWMIPVTDDFWDPRHSPLVPKLFVNGVLKATCSYVGQTLPVIWEAPDDPDVKQTTHDRRHVFDPSTIISKGGTVQIEARVNDPFSPQERAFGLVAWPTPIPVENEADLEITKTDSSDPVLAGDNLAYTLTVRNNGPSDATEVVVVDTLPTNIPLVSLTPSQGRATESVGVVTWNVGDLVSGASATLTIIVTVSSSAEDDSTLTNRAIVSAVETDPNTADNSDTETTTVNKEGDEDEEESKTPTYLIWINKRGDGGRIHVGTKEEFERPKKYRNEWLFGMSDEYLEKEMIGGPFESMDEATNKACDMIEPYYVNVLGWGKVPYAKYGGKAYYIDRDLENSCMPP